MRAAISYSTAASASAAISSSVRSWIGWATNTPRTGEPSAARWVSAASMNSEEATNTEGMPRRSRSSRSCTLHDVQLPQSARASTTAPHSRAICALRSVGAGLVKVGLR